MRCNKTVLYGNLEFFSEFMVNFLVLLNNAHKNCLLLEN